jgi:hypothetical protein
MHKTSSILEEFGTLRWMGRAGEAILCTFFVRRIQSLWACTHGIWLYSVEADIARESADELAELEVDALIRSIMEESPLARI